MRAFTVIGPSQSGKSTLIGALAGLEGVKTQTLKLMGDASVTKFDFLGDRWAVFDIPGGQDNISLIGPALAASDAAVLCAPAEADAAVLSAPYLRILEESGVPAFLFVNKIDVGTDRISEIVGSLQTYSSHGIVLRQVPMRAGDEIVGAIDLISERAWEYHDGQRSSLVEVPTDMVTREQEARSGLLESLADFDDGLLEQIIEDQIPMTDDLYSVATRVLQHHDLVPTLIGSAVHGNGILRLMKSLRHEVPEVGALRERLGFSGEVKAVSCLADNMKHVGKTVLIRAISAGVAPGTELCGASISNLVDLDIKTQISSLAEGEIGLAIKSDHLTLGSFFTHAGAEEIPPWAQAHPAAMRRMVSPVRERDENKVSTALARIAEIDVGMQVSQDETTGRLVITVQGPQHLRRITDRLADAFGIEVECKEVPTALRETVRRKIEKRYRHRKQSGGAGQFADILIEMEPMPLGTGFTFEDTVKGGAVPRNYIPSVEAGARDALAEGPEGHPVVDVRVTLKDGKAHSVDSSDFAFRTAGASAVREALSETGTAVLQPVMKVHIHVPSVFAGGLVQLVSGLKGQVLGFEGHPTATGWDIFRTLLPMASEEELNRALGSATRGTAWFSSELDHYEELRERASVKA